MSACKCQWDGNLDGHLRRCHAHQQEYLRERRLRKELEQELAAILTRDYSDD